MNNLDQVWPNLIRCFSLKIYEKILLSGCRSIGVCFGATIDIGNGARLATIVIEHGFGLCVECFEAFAESFLHFHHGIGRGKEKGSVRELSVKDKEERKKREGGEGGRLRTTLSSSRLTKGSPVMSSLPSTLGGLKERL